MLLNAHTANLARSLAMAELSDIRGPMNSNDGIACKFPVPSDKELILKQRMTSQDGFELKASNRKQSCLFISFPQNL